MPCSLDDTIPRELVASALEGILASREFRNATRKRRFVQFVVNEALAGRTDHIKAYAIALDVFDRDASFDPMLDPIVRIQAGRIRRSLERYYDTEGADARVRITIPKGSYAPQFVLVRSDAPCAPERQAPERQSGEAERNRAPPSPHVEHATNPSMAVPSMVILAAAVLVFVAALLVPVMSDLPVGTRSARQEPSSFGITPAASLMVLPFTNGTGDPAQDIVADGFTEDLVGALVRSQRVRVFGADSHERTPSPLHKARPDVRMDYVLRGSISQSGEQVQVTTVLSDGRNRRYLWAEDIRRETRPDTVVAMRQDIALEVVQALTQQNGVFDTEDARSSAARPPAALSSPECGSFRTLMSWIGLTAPC